MNEQYVMSPSSNMIWCLTVFSSYSVTVPVYHCRESRQRGLYGTVCDNIVCEWIEFWMQGANRMHEARSRAPAQHWN